ncbi:hypothetical protein [Rickettsia bellii]|uniref:Uncharacterized protein n=1 Tax=Rickettsia bellii (strain RML369-C) TaxID=336407 RepID=Q1RJZ8_RICBR|nr:hypothetical protein [Rickettsia bellii]ABE04316.1 unknown [Rickettsia bellii RML369-C]
MPNTLINFSHFVGLSKEQESELLNLLKRLHSFSGSLKTNLKDLEADIFSILKSSLKELAQTENLDLEKIEKLFNKTIKTSLSELSKALDKTYQDQLKTKDIFLFDGIIVEKCLSVLEQVLKFQKELDEVYPGASKKIITSLENILVAVIATQLPILSTFIKASGILEKVNNLIDHEKLLPKIKKWHNDIKNMQQEIRDNKNLKDVYKKAEQVAEISEISNEPVKKIIEVAKNPNNQSLLDYVIEANKAIPQTTKEVEEKISKIKSDVEKALPEEIKDEKLHSIKNTISDRLNSTKTELLKAANPETPFVDKITSLFKAAETATKIASDVKKIAGVIPGGQKLENVISGIITTNLIPKPILTIAKLAPEVAELVKVGKAIITVLSKSQNLNQTQGRSKSA